MTNWDKIRKDWETSDISLKDLAKKYNVSYSTLTSRKRREKWTRHGNKGNQNAKGNKGGSAPLGNKNAEGNKGGRAPKNNKNAVSHGLYSNFLPEETRQLMAELHQMTPADMIWQNILIQYAAIIRSQKIMYVQSEYDSTSNIIGVRVDPQFVDKDGQPVKTEEKREWHMAYEKQERFMNAQSRAMATLASLIKQFVALADDDDKRKLELKSMQTRIKLMELKANENNFDDKQADDGFIEALKGEVGDVWSEE